MANKLLSANVKLTSICSFSVFSKNLTTVRFYSRLIQLDAVRRDFLTSKEIRKLYIDYFKNHDHTYVHSSPIFLNNDPSLLFVNAGMNQFKPKLLDRIAPNHKFYNLKRATNIQKCIRINGKHNDLDDVGYDFHHHTFFEMMGNWSFGDYSKEEACTRALELLNRHYNLPIERLFFTYFGGDEKLGLPPDTECKNIWLNLGIQDNRILPFGTKDNFWDMGDTGPCGPCTEIHYDYLGRECDANTRINAGRLDLIEVWNLVFIEYKRQKDARLEPLSSHSVDTGMGLERLTAIVQGTQSNYDTDIFKPIFKAMEKNFNIGPYGGQLDNEVDIAYRIIADHTRMVTVAISDGLFPDNSDVGYILRKVLKRSAYLANKVLKTRPGQLSSIVPYIADTLDFYPEISKHVYEVISIVNEEEKHLHHAINKARRIRNKMINKTPNKSLDGQSVWELCNVHGLEGNIAQDLISEVNCMADWAAYEELCRKHKKATAAQCPDALKNTSLPFDIVTTFIKKNIPFTDDHFKYRYTLQKGVENVTASITMMLINGRVTNKADAHQKCFLVTDKTNFYSTAGGQVSDIGTISTQNSKFKVKNVYRLGGYVFHEGEVVEGTFLSQDEVAMSVEMEHRQKCAHNHTATHLLNAALRRIFPYTSQQSSYVGPESLKLEFSCKSMLTVDNISEIEVFVNKAIAGHHPVTCKEMPLDDIQGIPHVVLLRGEDYPEHIRLISIGNDENGGISAEPCCGTHVNNTSEICSFVVTNCKSESGAIKSITAVTGDTAKACIKNGNIMMNNVHVLMNEVMNSISGMLEEEHCLSLLKQVGTLLQECSVHTKMQFRIVKICEEDLKDMKTRLEYFMAKETDKQAEMSFEDQQRQKIPQSVLNYVAQKNIQPTDDSFKLLHLKNLETSERAFPMVTVRVLAAFHNGEPVQSIPAFQPFIIVTDKSLYYAHDKHTICDWGNIHNEECEGTINDVYRVGNHLYHVGVVSNGTLKVESTINTHCHEDFRRQCSFHHVASHLLHSALKKQLPYVLMHSNFANQHCVRLEFKAKQPLTVEDVQAIEDYSNVALRRKGTALIFEAESDSIGNNEDSGPAFLLEPCCRPHVDDLSELKKIIVITSKVGKNSMKVLQAVCGDAADSVESFSASYDLEMLELEEKAQKALDLAELEYMTLLDIQKELKSAKQYYFNKFSYLTFRKHQDKLAELSEQIRKATNNFVQKGFVDLKSEVEDMMAQNHGMKYVVHMLTTRGDGKKLVNVALNSFKDRPSIFFAHEGHKTVICSCSVPKEYVTGALSAQMWLEPVAAILKGKARFQAKEPELYFSIESEDFSNINEAIKVARTYIESHL